jgi:hypothetical protein
MHKEAKEVQEEEPEKPRNLYSRAPSDALRL